MNNENSFTLINEQTGNLACKLLFFNDNSHFDHFQRNNYFTLIWLKKVEGTLHTLYSKYSLNNSTMFAFAPFQPFMVQSKNCEGIAIYFHSDFFCIHKHQTEITCNGVLFNNIHQSPDFQIDNNSTHTFNKIISDIKSEIKNPSLAQYEMLVSYIKILLIAASRIKVQSLSIQPNVQIEPEKLQRLKDLIEMQFRKVHSPSEYAKQLNISSKALGKIVKEYYNKTFKELISERILIETKRELYLTNKTIKEIAYEMGYKDEYYFSRFFKKNTEISPQHYRNTVGFGRIEVEKSDEFTTP